MKNYIFQNFETEFERREKILLYILLFTVFVCLLAKYSLYYPFPLLDLFLLIINLLLFFVFGKDMFDIDSYREAKYLIWSAIFVYVVVVAVYHWEQPLVGTTFQILFLGLILSLHREFKLWLFDRFVSILAILFAISIVEYVFAVFGGISFVQNKAIYRFEHSDNYFYQGLINLFPYNFSFDIPRFQAFTEEPGLVGTLCSFLIPCLDSKCHRWQRVIFILAGVLSLSLAFYILFFLWIFYVSIISKSFKTLVSLSLGLAVLYFTFSDSIQSRIVDRIADREIEDIGNRTSDVFDKEFDNFIHTDAIFLGNGIRTFQKKTSVEDGGNSGVKVFIYSYGIISLILLFIPFSYLFIQWNGKNHLSLFVLLIFWISYYQRCNWTAPYYVIVLFLYGGFNGYMLDQDDRTDSQLDESVDFD